jgi:hypothetical protein
MWSFSVFFAAISIFAENLSVSICLCVLCGDRFSSFPAPAGPAIYVCVCVCVCVSCVRVSLCPCVRLHSPVSISQDEISFLVQILDVVCVHIYSRDIRSSFEAFLCSAFIFLAPSSFHAQRLLR